LKAIYIAPTRSLVQEKAREWAQRFGNELHLQVREVTGDTEKDSIRQIHDADIICTTPEKLDSLTRRAKDGIRILSEVS
jgi:ATP-dependent DNA helicase HFM1/MER3